MRYRVIIRCTPGDKMGYHPDEEEEFIAADDDAAIKSAEQIMQKKDEAEKWDVTRSIKEIQKIIFSD